MLKLLTTCTLWLLSLAAMAAPLSAQQARQRVAAQFSARGVSLASQPVLTAPQYFKGKRSVGHRQSSIVNDAAFYVFPTNQGQGYVILSGDDRTEPILAYSDHDAFPVEGSAESLPDGLQWLLQSYAAQIRLLDALPSGSSSQSSAAARSARRNQQARRPVPPLLQTLWNQGHPYNLLCPRYYREDGTQGDLSATGCVATAIAQVMAYYRYPEKTLRMIPGYALTYPTSQGEKRVQLRNIPAGSVIQWENMADNYVGAETEAQQQAVAELMYWVGVGCKMGYGPSSGAGFPEGVKALINYFGYDDATRIESRGNYTAAAWDNLLYGEIASGHPIAFAGTNTGGAHAFVLDGYDLDGLYHVNWGWGGMCNGYFRIDVLAPDDNSGIGASITPDAYNMGQDAIIGMQRPDDVPAPEVLPQLTVNDWEIRQGNVFFANYVNWSGVSADWNMGIARVDEAGNLVVLGSYRTQWLGTDTYVGCEFPVKGLQEGVHRLVPVSKRASDGQWQSKCNPELTYILAVVDAAGNVNLSFKPTESIRMTAMNFPGNLRRGDRQPVVATFHNDGDEYLREIHLLASRTSSKGEAICRTNVGILADGDATAAFSFTPDASGTWNVWLATDRDGRNVVGQGTVVISDQGIAPTHNLRYVSNSIGNRSAGVVYGNMMQGKVTILNQAAEPFDGKLRLWLHKKGDGDYYYGATSIYVPMHIDPSKTAQASFFFDHLELGATYALSILYEEGGDIVDGGLRQMGRTQAGIVCWQQNMTLSGLPPTHTVNTPSAAVAVDMSSLPGYVTTVVPNANPNTIYIFAAGETCPEGLDGHNTVIGGRASSITLTDGYGFFSPLAFTADEATYSRPSQPDRWQTIALPFAVSSLPDGVALQEFAEVGDDGQVVFAPVQQMEGHVPYLLLASAADDLVFGASGVRFLSAADVPMMVGTDDYRFCGTTVSRRLDGIFALNAEGTAFEPADTPVQVDAFRAYFTAPAALTAIPTPSQPTGIEVVGQSTPPADHSAIYDLSGRRIASGQHSIAKGIYIQNHKKMLIRR